MINYIDDFEDGESMIATSVDEAKREEIVTIEFFNSMGVTLELTIDQCERFINDIQNCMKYISNNKKFDAENDEVISPFTFIKEKE